MSESSNSRRSLLALGAAAPAALLLTGCISNEPAASGNEGGEAAGGTAQAAPGSANDETGETVTMGFSAPAADHGWMGAITTAAQEEAAKFEDIELQVAEGTNDVNVQISQVETFINDGVDTIVLLPFDGAALTEVATNAMNAGISVVNVDRELASPEASRVTVLGDNYGMGRSAGQFIGERLADTPDAVIAEIAGPENLPLTQDRSQGFADALGEYGLQVSHGVAGDFTVQGGTTAATNLLQAAPHIDAIWNHDDDQGVGVLAAIENAGRDEFFLVGGAGSANMMREIQDEESVVVATVIYPATQAADGIRLARLLAQGKALSDLVEVEVPRMIQLYAPVVTADNVDQYIDSAFES